MAAFDALGAGVAKEDAGQIQAGISAGVLRQFLRHQTRQQRAIHADQVRHDRGTAHVRGWIAPAG